MKQKIIEISVREKLSWIKELHKRIEQLKQSNQSLEQEVVFYAASKSWQITRPLRTLRKFLSKKNMLK